MKKKLFAFLFVLIGLTSIVLGLVSYSMDTGYIELSHTYGGDAYTGIQNAAAQTANNVKELAQVTTFGFGSILLVSGLFMIVMGVKMLVLSCDLSNEPDSEHSGEPTIAQDGYWTCQCGKINSSQTDRCDCGANRQYVPAQQENPSQEI